MLFFFLKDLNFGIFVKVNVMYRVCITLAFVATELVNMNKLHTNYKARLIVVYP